MGVFYDLAYSKRTFVFIVVVGFGSWNITNFNLLEPRDYKTFANTNLAPHQKFLLRSCILNRLFFYFDLDFDRFPFGV